MAARRITKSAVDWIAFVEKVPTAQRSQYLLFKGKSDSYLAKCMSLPENPPKFDWNAYRSKIALPGLVDQFEKEYTALKIPYPTTNAISEIDNQEKETEKEVINFIKASEATVAEYKQELEQWANIIPFEHMTLQDFRDTFPQYAMDTFNRPTLWPHIPEEQLDYDDSETKPAH